MTTATAGPTVRPAETDAMRRALELAATDGLVLGPNPRVGCVLLDADGATIAEGFHRGAGTPHAETVALANARAAAGPDAARGATAVVTLEPCAHTGRTGPCAQALVDAGVGRVVFAQPDPNLVATGGGALLHAAGVDVVGGVLGDEARTLNAVWTRAMELGRPVVTWKVAASLDGRTAAADGTSRWITSAAARADVHRLRASCDTVLVGTGTVAADDPSLTVRDADLTGPQPLRAVMGRRELPPSSRLAVPADDGTETLHLRTHDPREALEALWAADRRHVLLEGGATLAAAFWRAGLVDEMVAYVAPVLLGAGPAAVGDLGITTIAGAARLDVVDVALLAAGTPGTPGTAGADGRADAGPTETNVRLTLRPRKES
ncbi:diaminohydroxyphosphoribosylaminopyrimidine deaminase/5-amino-6-(5-phosphoribosylamino)uracil reductase [Isoptericola sp. CG 20/1183]|uniref:Riboflavin biosynthesis protein RibD n=1 Tax=Isoptericola halotolerans TaxID=300560 RepID=A0ABX5EAC3_9MICO|nr:MULTISPECIES: bifunctional diaminohydroxyphosphoribosylaminopyrimidine deaminase/5-amino-6-(5-phosphoribosylamino)uracil reductase RibD [Isoptericola]PRZ03497.1 diaminohydroxyphosphoribosylaminopyrimidine deaminase/5-amino-6-(5-phosphoribosylamino)uracil reductase [Isoptericola sp. CG 20/1183]PRZ03784.1 diaminohydroxyphosphoribosylaminopyrimidine deaminase/5-amino-6-(5-phosphoribosylamino)uracil reductase [Isoptericola halotolerans]